ncbi:MAG: DUF1993 domain-containing protein [Candidatus Omnitrophica bacterium]|nr:DUF1993 domain-containing protein [Candidatus Omnitrophota bacterium]
MSLSMYEASIPVFISKLNNLLAILKKAEAHALAKKIEPEVFINARLAPDMFPLSRQIQIASDGVKGCAARLAGVEVPSYPDTEKTFPELQARIAKTIEFLKTFSAKNIDGSEERRITLKLRGQETSFFGQPYLLNFVLPNFYFHICMAYAILRHNGLDIGKMDYLSDLMTYSVK